MTVISWDEFIRSEGHPAAVTMGVFDGVHRGHQALINRIVERGPFPTVITFAQNPKGVLSPASYKGDIQTLDQRLRTFEEMGVERVVLIDFSEDFSRIKGSDFIGSVMSRGKLAFLALGANFRCGFRLDFGAAEIEGFVQKGNIPVEVFEPLREGGKPISSSRIRQAIRAGAFEEAALLLGRAWPDGPGPLNLYP
ncbi:hypothetical protein AGMMS49928_29660 [Spirochaetia bacterium]|nr:hypothetical protein AGMMS49928_29660 [Spirochaetia bacterium]